MVAPQNAAFPYIYFCNTQWEIHLGSPHGLVPVPNPMHMWFLQYMFLISLVSLPLLLYLDIASFRNVARRDGSAYKM